ncbi:hypothetical protein BN873_p10064 [Candidatus Competibacter denitrificans Run_A_D11]|uniref:Preprotein translocase subunit SecB n=1 Tax=Candidatus Competibacter denitrificans Run_A_D11 TaxID=1400863 RepID=W6MD51_9GAMM|nr:hypothetical protein [Candidatus Competibacter denitrificans]CDI04620.1 hypothetical protein BN873_p10064 [Candidatus Competibacter denitrificans Run_A_D11]
MNRSLIDQAIQALDIQTVSLNTATIKCRKGFLPHLIESDLLLTPQHRAGPTGEFNIVEVAHKEGKENFKVVIFFFSAGVRLVNNTSLDTLRNQAASEDEAVYVEITAEFSVRYVLKKDVTEEKLQDALKEFARYNVGYHVWPYWREYVQSTCGRIGIPPIPLPMYQLPQLNVNHEPAPA